MSPEIVSGQAYNESSDLWSCGVIMYLLLSGQAPFYGQTTEDIIASIKNAHIDFSSILKQHIDPQWKRVNSQAKDLICCLLAKNPQERITANKAVQHPWLRMYDSSAVEEEEQKDFMVQSLRNLKNFIADSVFQKAILSYIAAQELDPCEEKKLKQLFDILDIDKSGHVTFDNLLVGYTKLYNNKLRAQQTSAEIMKRADVNNNGAIDYNGINYI